MYRYMDIEIDTDVYSVHKYMFPSSPFEKAKKQ